MIAFAQPHAAVPEAIYSYGPVMTSQPSVPDVEDGQVLLSRAFTVTFLRW